MAKNASLVYTLPMATTNKIKAKNNDSREGLLGMANDPENYGDLYVVGEDGKSHLTKCGIKSEILFEGEAIPNNEYSLIKPITDFKELLICFSVNHETDGEDMYKEYVTIPVSDIRFSDDKQFIKTIYSTNYLTYTFTNDFTLKVNGNGSATSGWLGISIKRIVGIY